MTTGNQKLFLIWCGLIFGVSFLATPAKFLAPELELSLALQIGRVTFQIMSFVEFSLLTTSFIIIFLNNGRSWKTYSSSLILTALLAIQYLGVLPLLGNHTEKIFEQGGQHVTPSFLHSLFIFIEALKLGLLLALGVKNPALANEKTFY
jgi:hypothetical protein